MYTILKKGDTYLDLFPLSFVVLDRLNLEELVLLGLPFPCGIVGA